MNENELTPVGKLFITSIVAWVNNDAKLNWNLHGTPEQVNAFTNAIIASKKFQQLIKTPTGVTVDDIVAALNAKNQAAKDFETITGKKWPL